LDIWFVDMVAVLDAVRDKLCDGLGLGQQPEHPMVARTITPRYSESRERNSSTPAMTPFWWKVPYQRASISAHRSIDASKSVWALPAWPTARMRSVRYDLAAVREVETFRRCLVEGFAEVLALGDGVPPRTD
jgi:hypothetical protein